MKTWTSTITYSVFDMGRECETEEEYKKWVKQSFKVSTTSISLLFLSFLITIIHLINCFFYICIKTFKGISVITSSNTFN